MNLLFAHHDMIRALDFLHLHPVTPKSHVVAILAYALLLLAVTLSVSGLIRLLKRRRTRSLMADLAAPRLASPAEEAS